MIRLIATRTFLHNIYDHRFALTLAIVLGLVTATAFLSVRQTSERQQSYDRLRRMAWRVANLESVKLVRRPAPLSFLYDGGEDELPRYLIVTTDFVDYPIEEVSVRAVAEPFVRMDWAFVVVYFYGLLALLLTFDFISGQKERRTLSMVLAHSISRGELLLGGYLGMMLTLLPALLIGILIYLLIARVQGIWIGSPEEWMRVLLILVLSAIFVSSMAFLGLLASAAFEKSAASLMAAFLLWVLMTVVGPAANRLIVERLVPAPSFKELQTRIGSARAEYRSNLAAVWSMDIARIIQDPRQTPEQRERKLAEYQFEILEKNRRAIAKYKSDLRRLRTEHLRHYERRATWIRRLDLVSPSAAYRQGLEALIGAGRTQLEAFAKAAERYMREYTRFALQKQRELEGQADWRGFILEESGYRVRQVTWLDYSRVEFDRRALPQFADPSITLREGIAVGSASFLALILLNLLLFLAVREAVLRCRAI